MLQVGCISDVPHRVRGAATTTPATSSQPQKGKRVGAAIVTVTFSQIGRLTRKVRSHQRVPFTTTALTNMTPTGAASARVSSLCATRRAAFLYHQRLLVTRLSSLPSPPSASATAPACRTVSLCGVRPEFDHSLRLNPFTLFCT